MQTWVSLACRSYFLALFTLCRLLTVVTFPLLLFHLPLFLCVFFFLNTDCEFMDARGYARELAKKHKPTFTDCTLGSGTPHPPTSTSTVTVISGFLLM